MLAIAHLLIAQYLYREAAFSFLELLSTLQKILSQCEVV